MSMPVEKAKEVLEAYKQKGYNAKQALTSVGYSVNTAHAQGARTIDTAINTLARAAKDDEILEFLGMTEKDLAREYGKVIAQDKNYPAKLRALEPLLKRKGIQWLNEKATVIPQVNITMQGKDGQKTTSDNLIDASIANPSLNQATVSDDVAQSTLCDMQNEGGEVRFQNGRPKEVGSPTQNFSEKVTIDNNEKVLQNEEGEIPRSFTE